MCNAQTLLYKDPDPSQEKECPYCGITFADCQVKWQQYEKDELKRETDAHSKIAAGASSMTGILKVIGAKNESVRQLFEKDVYVAYVADKQPFLDAESTIGNIEDQTCYDKYETLYLSLTSQSGRVQMNNKIRDALKDPAGVAKALSALLTP